MIKLEVEPYCDNCDGFEPIVERLRRPGELYIVIKCKYQSRCNVVYCHLKKQIESEDKNG